MVHTEEQAVNSWSEQHLTQQANVKHYPHYWWSFIISLLIILVFFILIYIKYIRPQIQLHRQQYHEQQQQSIPTRATSATPINLSSMHSPMSTSTSISKLNTFLSVFRKQKDWKPATSKRASTAIVNIGAYHAQNESNYHSLGVERTTVRNPWLRLSNTYYEDTDHSMDDNEYIFDKGTYSPSPDVYIDSGGSDGPFIEEKRVENVSRKRKFLKERERKTIVRGDGGSDDNCIMFKGKVRYNYENEFLMNQFMDRICAPMLENQDGR